MINKVEIKTDGTLARVYINGKEIENVLKYEIKHSAKGYPFPILKLEIINPDSIFYGETVDCRIKKKYTLGERIKKLWKKD